MVAQPERDLSRRAFLKSAGVAGGLAAGILAFPQATQIVEAVAPGVQRVTRSYPKVEIARIDSLKTREPLDFLYPLTQHRNFLVKLGEQASDGLGPDGDIVAFSYICSHMGCPLIDQYKPAHNVIGPCPCHYSTFDLSKNGILVIGQATQSLPQIVLETDGRHIYAVGVTGLVYGHSNNLTGGVPVKPLGGSE